MKRRDMLGWAAAGGIVAALAVVAGVPPTGRRSDKRVDTAGIDGPSCLAALDRAGVEYERLADFRDGDFCRVNNVVRVTRLAGMELAHPFTANCRLALAVDGYASGVIAPAARRHLGSDVARLHHLGTYACRRIGGRTAGPPSQHASAMAIDISAFELADGRVVAVLDDWPSLKARVGLGAAPGGRFLHAIAQRAHRHFTTVLTPDFDRAHANHFHLGLRTRRVLGRS